MRAAEFLQGWLLEYALSVDNVFVFLVVFRYFRVPQEHLHRVLFWGIIGRGHLAWRLHRAPARSSSSASTG